ncbi:MAG TPA: haloacid dehalogenase [Solibacterales bacterium]|nr:haloacid dehalogenase [Bryobacterales bacterium]
MQAFLFDMDGVIVDSNPVHTVAWQIYLDRFGIVVPGLEDRMFGRRNDEIIRDFFPMALTDEEVFRHGANKEALYRELMGPQIASRLVPGVLDFLAARREVPAALATNAEPKNVAFVLDAAGLSDRFLAVVDGHQVERPKPHPEIYLKAARLVGAEPKDCVVFEDSYAGAEAARAAGARVVGVTTSHETFPDVDFTIAGFDDPRLAQWLGNGGSHDAVPTKRGQR